MGRRLAAVSTTRHGRERQHSRKYGEPSRLLKESSVLTNRISNYASLSFFACLFVLGLVCYRDYGVTWDEFQQRATGAVSLKYVTERLAPSFLPPSAGSIAPLKEYKDRDYGVAFELPAVALEVILGLTDEKDVYLFRHLLNFLVAFAGTYALYLMARRRFGNWRMGLLTALFLVLSPRLFAESFYNSKDIVFMAVFCIATNTMISYVLKPNVRTALPHALATAIAIDVRLMAVILPFATLSILVARLLKREVSLSRAGQTLSLYAGAACLFVLVMWPWLWADPIGNLAQAFANMAQFRWQGDVLYFGEFIRGTEIPWHYIPVWISITTPIPYLLLFLAGAFVTLRQIKSSGTQLWKSDEELQDIVYLGLFIAPIAAVIVLHSVLYHGWRHLFFVYPAFLMIAIRGWHCLWTDGNSPTIRRPLLVGATAISIASTGFWMWQAHPFENVYFNMLAGRDLKNRFDLDYFGMANRKALEYIVAHDQSAQIEVTADSFTLVFAAFKMINADDRKRLRISDDRTRPHYLFNNYYLQRDRDDSKYDKDYVLFYQISVGGEVILSVFRSKPTNGEGSKSQP